MRVITVAILGDQTLPCLAVNAVLENISDIHIAHIGKMENGTCLENWAKQPPHILLWLANPAECQWQKQLRKIQRHLPKTSILFLADKVEGIYPNRLLKAGVRGYLSQQTPIEHLIKAIHRAANGQGYCSPDVVQYLIDPHLQKPTTTQAFHQLSNRELDILYQLVKGESKKTIAKTVHVEPSTINCYVCRLLKRLQCNNTLELVHLAAQYHLIDPPTPPIEFKIGHSE